MPPFAEARSRVLVALRKKPQTARELCDRIGRGYIPQHIATVLHDLEVERQLVRHHGRPPSYSKP